MLKQALRSLRLSPAFALTVIATLGIGIGLNAAIFTVVDNLLLKPLGYHDADRIVAIQTRFNEENRSIPRLAGDDYNDLARTLPGLEATARYISDNDGMRVAGVSVYAPMAIVSPRFAQILGVEPVAGRLFNPADQDGHDALVSAAFARDHFGSAQAALGQPLLRSDQTYTIIGVLPQSFSFPAHTQAWFEGRPVTDYASRSSYDDRVVARIRPGLTYPQFAAQLAVFSAELSRSFADDRKKSIEAVPLRDQLVQRIRPTLNLLMGSVLVILLIVSVNITHLQLVRATQQMRSISVRTALGASRATLAGRALLESALLALAGSVAALLLAYPVLRLLLHLAPANTPRLADIHLNLDVFAFSAAVALVVMAITALLPVWKSWHVDPAQALRGDASRGTESRRSLRLRNGFIVAEIALTLMLSVSAVLLTRQMIAQSRQDLGFTPDTLLMLDTHAILATTRPPANADKAVVQAYLDAMFQHDLARLDATLATLGAAPGVASVSAIDTAPMFSGPDAGYAIEGRQAHGEGIDLPEADIRAMSPDNPATLGVPLLRGRQLSAQDRLGTPMVALVNQTFVQHAFGAEDPLGKRLWTGYDNNTYTIVGVLGDTRNLSPALAPAPTLYLAMAQHPYRAADAVYMVRTRAQPAQMTDPLRQLLARTHPELAVKATTMQQNIGVVQQPERFRTTLFALFAAVAILLAAVGMYGVTAYTVAQRRFEYGLRLALGANRTQLLGMVFRSGLLLAVGGVVAGTLLSVSLQRVLAGLLGPLPAFDALAYTLASCAVLAIALAATLIPARRATRVDPMNVLRSE